MLWARGDTDAMAFAAAVEAATDDLLTLTPPAEEAARQMTRRPSGSAAG